MKLDISSRSKVLNLLIEIIKWRKKNPVQSDWSHLHLSIVHNYFSNISSTCDFRELPSAKLLDDSLNDFRRRSSKNCASTAASFTQELLEIFTVPRLIKFYESKHRIKKYQVVEAFVRFLLQLLHHRTDVTIDSFKYRVDKFEEELRFLHTILGDSSLMQSDEDHEEFQKLVEEFEAVANEAGSVVHSMFFSADRARMQEGLHAVLNHIHLLKINVTLFLSVISYNSRSAYTASKKSVVYSLLIVNYLVYDLEDLINGEDNLSADVKNQIKILHEDLILLRCSIKDIGTQQPSDLGELREPLIQIGDLAQVAKYLIISFVAGDAPIWYLTTRLMDINHKIELIGTQLQQITTKYKFGALKVAECSNNQLSLQAQRNLEVGDIIVGFEDLEVDILEQLLQGRESLTVISIFGMPGLGKTTLANKLYNCPSVKSRFDRLSWCVVSQSYQRKSILTDILNDIASELENHRISHLLEESLADHIYKTLKWRRYLIVIDDIWDSDVLDGLKSCLPDDGNGSRILLTTRNKDVAPHDAIIHELTPLSSDQCWEILEKKVFENKPCPPALQGIGRQIAANCFGLPLAVVVIAGILSTREKKKSRWEKVGNNLASYIFSGTDSVKQILELSYKHLRDHLKPCFLYFGALEEVKEIHVGNLLRFWIAEGFIPKEAEKSPENVAEGYLMELIDKSLVMVAKRRSDGGVKSCSVHDLLRDLCLRKCEEENILGFLQDNIQSTYEYVHPRLEKLQFHMDSIRCRRRRSRASSFPVRDIRSLRVVHLCSRSIDLTGIGCLVYLRYLVVCDLPPSLGSLVYLEYLRVETYKTVYLPPVIAKMMRLRHIDVSPEARYDEHCNSSSSQTNNLKFLSRLSIRKNKDVNMLKCSPYLRKLKCICSPLLSQRNTGKRFADLRFLTELESLKIAFCRLKQDAAGFPSNIRKLTLSALLWRDISIIGKLEQLEVLKLESFFFVGERWDTGDGQFEKLRFLKMVETNLTEWNVDSSEHFPRLQRLVLIDCPTLQEIPSEIGEIAMLQLIEVYGRCPNSVVESAKRILQEQWDEGNQELRVITDMLRGGEVV